MKHARSFRWASKHYNENGRDYTREGWLPEGAPNFDPGIPVHVAHDTLEHFNGSEAFHRELMAFGSILYGRAYTDPTGEMIEVASDDLSGFLEAQNFGVKHAMTRWDRPLKDPKAERMVRQLVDQAYIKLAMFKGVPPKLAKQATAQCAPWIRLGYRLADRRWKGDHEALDSMFVEVFNKVAFDHNIRHPHVGDRLTVDIDTNRLHRVKLHREPA